jgi:Zn finger protein HypA/HybF involved in hydrogenase expression
MHELTIASALFDVVSRQAQLYPGEQVVAVAMSIGGWQALEPEAVQTCFAGGRRRLRLRQLR